MTNKTPIYQQLHALYCSLTMRNVTFDFPVLMRWELWHAKGWGEEELLIVVRFIKQKIARKERKTESLRLHNLIDVARFEDDLIDARGAGRRRVVDRARRAVLEQTGRNGDPAPKPVQTPAEIMAAATSVGMADKRVMADAKALEDFRKWRMEAGL